MRARRKAPSAAEAESIAQAEAAAMASARQARARVVEDALTAVIAEIIETVPLIDEARERLTEVLRPDRGNGDEG
jgi:hypothetical protein